MTIRQILTESVKMLHKNEVSSARLDAEILIGRVLGVDRAGFIIRADEKITPDNQKKILEFITRRSDGEPVAYLVGEKEFFKHSFKVNSSVLVPRPETEIIVEEALRILSSTNMSKIMDFGCGTGCIGLSIAAQIPAVKLTSIDVSNHAIEVAKENAKRMNISAQFLCEDVFELNNSHEADLIVANPPYIDANDPNIERKTLRFEPSLALYSRDQGYRDPIGWAKKASEILKPQGILLMEIGADQAERIQGNIRNWFRRITFLTDLAGFKRVVRAEK